MAKTKGVSIRDISEGVKSINFDIFGGIDGFLSMTSGGGGDDITQAQQLRRVVPWLAKAVDMTANAVSALPFAILRENGEPYDTSADWKNKTGGLESPESLFYMLASSLCFGRAYLIPQLTSRAIVDMQFVAPQTVRAEITRDGLKWFDRTTDKGAVSRYYPIESELDPVMVYFWLPDSDVEIGPALTHPAGNALLSARLLFNMDGTIATYAERGFIPPTVLGAKGMPGPAEREKAERWWDRFFRGKTDIAAKIINTEALSVVKVGAGMEDIRGAYPELTKQMIENIATAFGIPSGLFMSDMAFATEIKHLIKIWYTTSAFVKVYKAIETGFNEQVLKPWGLKLKFDPNAIDAMQEEEMERATAFSTYVNAGMRPSVAAEMLGIELPQGVKFADLDADMAAKQQREQLLAEAQAMRFQQSNKGDEKPGEKESDRKEVKMTDKDGNEGRWVTIDGNHVFIEQDGDRPFWAGENSIEYSGYKLRNGRFLNKDKWAVDDGETTAPFEDSPEKAVSSYLEYVSINNELRITAENRNSAVSRIKDGSYTEKDLRVLSNGYGKLSEHSLVALARATGMRDKDARQFVSRLPNNASAGINSYGNEMYYIDVVAGLLSGKKSLSLTADQIKELNLWRQIAERNFRKGKGACADFEVKSLPEDMAADIRERLKYVTGKEDIGQAFEVTGTPQAHEIDNEAIKTLADAINRAVDAGVKADGHWVTINGDHVFIDERGNPQNAPYLDKDKKQEESSSAITNGKIVEIGDEIRSDSKESYLLIDPKTGNVVYRQTGDEMSTGIIPEHVLNQAGENIIMHNHPSDISFSAGDLNMIAKYPPQKDVIVTPGATYILAPKDGNNWPSTREFGRAYSELSGKVANRFPNFSQHGTPDGSQVWTDYTHALMQEISKELNLNYERIPKG